MSFLDWMGTHPVLTVLILTIACTTICSLAETLRRE